MSGGEVKARNRRLGLWLLLSLALLYLVAVVGVIALN